MTTFTFYLPVPYESDNSVEWTDSNVWTQATCHPCERHTEIFFSSVCFMISAFGIAVLVLAFGIVLSHRYGHGGREWQLRNVSTLSVFLYVLLMK